MRIFKDSIELMDSPFEYFNHAECFLKTYADNIDLVFRKRRIPDEFRMSMVNVAFANHVFACELYLKCLLLIENNPQIGHQLKKLWAAIQYKERIREIYKIVSDNSTFTIEEAISHSNNDYTHFRYNFQTNMRPPNDTIKIYAVHDIVIAIRRYLKELNPSWSLILDEAQIL